ncbi:uncharacterized protein LOC121285259 isoform X2 [Carcharodon carcharias]|uniref:uncharacterized protein LOC121285259 isoform X2 n=1 Tax=Carcharodon carcharias TaxID=13397 RepID=UPI001B7E7438|nr:uncharacterized protein LOC121285259 isoform X2 [Carcharodon carcharias]
MKVILFTLAAVQTLYGSEQACENWDFAVVSKALTASLKKWNGRSATDCYFTNTRCNVNAIIPKGERLLQVDLIFDVQETTRRQDAKNDPAECRLKSLPDAMNYKRNRKNPGLKVREHAWNKRKHNSKRRNYKPGGNKPDRTRGRGNPRQGTRDYYPKRIYKLNSRGRRSWQW